jgi:hypothetical protein
MVDQYHWKSEVQRVAVFRQTNSTIFIAAQNEFFEPKGQAFKIELGNPIICGSSRKVKLWQFLERN